MVLREAFPQGGGLLDEVGVVAGLRAVESGFQQAAVADAGGPAVALYLVVMDGEHFGEGEISRSFSQLLVEAAEFFMAADVGERVGLAVLLDEIGKRLFDKGLVGLIGFLAGQLSLPP